jgi:hypothetical protein
VAKAPPKVPAKKGGSGKAPPLKRAQDLPDQLRGLNGGKKKGDKY